MRVLINMLVRKKKIRIISRDMIKLYSLSLSLVSLSRYISVEGIRLKIRIT